MPRFDLTRDGRAELRVGDSRHVLKSYPDAHFDSVVCDPPYALVSIVKRFGGEGAAPATGNDAYARASAGFMGAQWDTGETAFAVEFWREVMRVLKPGGHVVAFSGSRTYHRLACAIEDAGFEIREQLMWLYSTGFPKAHDVSKGIDKAAGAKREVLEIGATRASGMRGGTFIGGDGEPETRTMTAPATEDAKRWEGWKSALKPAHEPIVLARKPLVGTVVQNVLAHGTGALNIGACRVDSGPVEIHARTTNLTEASSMAGRSTGSTGTGEFREGRFPPNLLHDGSEEVVALFPVNKGEKARTLKPNGVGHRIASSGLAAKDHEIRADPGGSAARYFPSFEPDGPHQFYHPKAGKADRAGSKHPTVKPVAVMRWLCRLVTPPGGRILDPFAGSGTTGQAAIEEGFAVTLVERDATFARDIARRFANIARAARGEPIAIPAAEPAPLMEAAE